MLQAQLLCSGENLQLLVQLAEVEQVFVPIVQAATRMTMTTLMMRNGKTYCLQ